MFTLVKIENCPTNYTDKHSLKKDKSQSIPLGCALTVKDGKAKIAATAEIPEYISTDLAPVGSDCLFALPVQENMLFCTYLTNPDGVAIDVDSPVSVFTDGNGALSVKPDANGKGKIVMLALTEPKVYVKFKKI